MAELDAMMLELLACPEDKSPVSHADEKTIEKLNALQSEGKLLNREGKPVEKPLDGGLVREDGRYLYPIVGGIPIMLIDRGIDLTDQLG